ncbi:MAG: hypothetical protein FJW20_09650 [Acidimicrobiia bacterium]|nr:hypothetical protein [Acidimicrobiia bacterium]
MSTSWILLAYGGSLFLSIALLLWLHPRAWYWHLLSLTAALALGFIPIPPSIGSGPDFDLIVGFAFTLLFVWGAGGLAAPLFLHRHHEHEHP